MPAPLQWTEGVIQEAVDLLSNGLPVMEVASRLNTTYCALIDALRRKHIRLTDIRPLARETQRQWTDAEDEILRHEWGIGTPRSSIGVRLKRSDAAIEARRKRLALPPRSTGGLRIPTADVEARAGAPENRRCLACRNTFRPRWRTNYICCDCTSTEAYSSPVTVHGFCA